MGWHTALRVMVLPVVLPVNRLPPMPLGRDRSLTVLFVHSRERYRRMRIGSARSHFGCDPNRFHNFLLRSAMPQRGFCVALNAVWRLSHVRDGNRNELFGLSGQSTVGKVRFAECLQCGLDTGSEFAPFCWQVLSTLLDSLIPTFVALCFPFRIFFACSERAQQFTVWTCALWRVDNFVHHGAGLFPILQERVRTAICQRMREELLGHLERHRGYMRAQLGASTTCMGCRRLAASTCVVKFCAP